MSVYFVDEVQITNITRDANFRTKTLGTPYLSKAYVEEDDKIVYSNGMPVQPARRVFTPYGIAVNIGDLIKTTKIKGEAISDIDREVVSVLRAGNFSGTHLEISVGVVRRGS